MDSPVKHTGTGVNGVLRINKSLTITRFRHDLIMAGKRSIKIRFMENRVEPGYSEHGVSLFLLRQRELLTLNSDFVFV